VFAAEAAAGAVEPGFLLENAYVVPLVMAASFALTLAIGRRLGKHASWIGIVSIGFCFLFALGANVQWYDYVDDSEHAARGVRRGRGTARTASPTPRTTRSPTPRTRVRSSDRPPTSIGPMVDGESAAARARRSSPPKRATAVRLTPSTR
jgi:hypothetical protein